MDEGERCERSPAVEGPEPWPDVPPGQKTEDDEREKVLDSEDGEGIHDRKVWPALGPPIVVVSFPAAASAHYVAVGFIRAGLSHASCESPPRLRSARECVVRAC